MFAGYSSPEDGSARLLAEEDQQLLLEIVRRNGLGSVINALSNMSGQPSRSSIVSANTLLSNTSVPSLAYTGSDVSNHKSDAASIRTQSTWNDTSISDIRSVPDMDPVKFPERTWLDSPGLVASPMSPGNMASQPSPRPVAPTNKKYQCPMCFLDNNPVGFGRKSDFKKHLHNFHGADVVWICCSKGCHLTFATERAYSTHAKETHRMEALPSSTARTELCPQLVFACGFPSCKDRIFEAQSREESSNSRDKYFEHIAKHFEDGFDVNDWAYRSQVQNLLRQSRTKAIFKTCIWPKERRQQLVWQPRSSGDLKRILECRHLGEDVSKLVRLAYILGTPPFSSGRTPPPSDIDAQFQLPIRAQCILDAGYFAEKCEKDETPTPTEKRRPSVPELVLNTLTNRRSRKDTRPSTSGSLTADTIMKDEPILRSEPHPGTPIHLPNSSMLPSDAPTFAPNCSTELPKQISQSPPQSGMMYSMPGSGQHHNTWMDVNYSGGGEMIKDEPHVGSNMVHSSQTSTNGSVRPATPTPHKRPASWSKRMSLESLRPKKKSTPQTSPHAQVGAPMGQPTSAPYPYYENYVTSIPSTMAPSHTSHVEYGMPMRTGHDYNQPHHSQILLAQQQQFRHQQQPYYSETPPMQLIDPASQTFFFDDGEGQIL